MLLPVTLLRQVKAHIELVGFGFVAVERSPQRHSRAFCHEGGLHVEEAQMTCHFRVYALG